MVEAKGPRPREKLLVFPTAWMSDRSKRPIGILKAASGISFGWGHQPDQ